MSTEQEQSIVEKKPSPTSSTTTVSVVDESTSEMIIPTREDDEEYFSRRMVVTSRFDDDAAQHFRESSSPSTSSPLLAGNPNLHHFKGHSFSSLDAKIDEQFEKAFEDRKKIREVKVASWNVSGKNRLELQDFSHGIGKYSPDLILLQDVNYQQVVSVMEELWRGSEDHCDDHSTSASVITDDNEPPVYKWFCCGHRNSSEPTKLHETIELASRGSDEDQPFSNSGNSPPCLSGSDTGSVQSIYEELKRSKGSVISKLLRAEVKSKVLNEQDANDLVTEYLPIIYNSEKLKCVDCGAFWLSKTPDEPGTKSWDSTLPRFCNWGAFVFKPDDEEDDHIDLFVFNTHWDYGVESRRHSAVHLRREILERTVRFNSFTNKTNIIPTITCGNFNSATKSNALSVLAAGIDNGAHNSDINTLANSDDEDDEEEEGPSFDKESLIIPCQKTLSSVGCTSPNEETPKSASENITVTGSTQPEDQKEEGNDTKQEENNEDEEEEDGDSSSSSYTGSWYHGANFEPTYVDSENNINTTLDYVFVSPGIKTKEIEVLQGDSKCGNKYHRPILATLTLV